jgi:hypothetical protein
MPRTFEEMFRDYDKELADVESERITQNRKTEEKYDGERKELLQDMQQHADDADLRMHTQLKFENTYANEDRDIKHNNEVAEGKRNAIEADRSANQQERIEASGLKYDSGPIPEPPPQPPPPPAPESKPLEAQPIPQEQSSGEGILRSMGENVVAQMANVAAAATGIYMNVVASFAHSEAGHSQSPNPEIEGQQVAGMPPEQHNAHPPHLERIETIEREAPQPPQAWPSRSEPEPRVQTTVHGVDEIVRPPPPPPPPANDNLEKSEGKSR